MPSPGMQPTRGDMLIRERTFIRQRRTARCESPPPRGTRADMPTHHSLRKLRPSMDPNQTAADPLMGWGRYRMLAVTGEALEVE